MKFFSPVKIPICHAEFSIYKQKRSRNEFGITEFQVWADGKLKTLDDEV